MRVFSEFVDSQTPKTNGAQNVNETYLLINQTLAITTDTNTNTFKSSICENEAALLALRSYIQCELSTLYEKIDRLIEKLNTTSNIELKPYEILKESIKLLQNALRSKDEIIKILMET